MAWDILDGVTIDDVTALYSTDAGSTVDLTADNTKALTGGQKVGLESIEGYGAIGTVTGTPNATIWLEAKKRMPGHTPASTNYKWVEIPGTRYLIASPTEGDTIQIGPVDCPRQAEDFRVNGSEGTLTASSHEFDLDFSIKVE